MSRMPNCKSCGNPIDKDLNNFTKNYRGYYHNKCYEVIQLENQHRIELNEYISKLYKVEFPTGWMLKQIKEYKEKRNYKYKGMELTLRYMYEVERLNKLDAHKAGLGMIPYYYEKAKQYFIDMRTASNSVKNFEFNSEVEVIYAKPPEKRKKKKLLDATDI